MKMKRLNNEKILTWLVGASIAITIISFLLKTFGVVAISYSAVLIPIKILCLCFGVIIFSIISLGLLASVGRWAEKMVGDN